MADSPEHLLEELIALPSVNPAFLPGGDARAGEWRMGDFLASLAARAGLPVEFQTVFPPRSGHRERSNVLVRLGPTRCRYRVILAPHLDTIGSADMPERHFTPAKRAGKLFGRGACDTKGSVAAMFTALLRLAESGSRPKNTEVVFAGLVDEENEQKGSRALAKSRLKANLALVGEPTELEAVTAHKGDMWLKLVTRGLAAHGSRPELGRNAVHEMARVIDLLETTYAATLRTRKHPLLGNPTINVGMVRGGTQPNVVPDYCEIQVDRRTIPGERDAAVRREIQSVIRKAGLKAEILSSKANLCVPLETDFKRPLVQSFLEATGQTEPRGADFFCDAAILAAGGIPSVVFGPGSIAQAHTENEWISIQSVRNATDILTRFLRSLP